METASRHAAILGELAELMLVLARKVQADAMAAETPEQTALLAKEVHRLGRGVRQTLALEARMAREARAAAREEARDARQDAEAERDRRLTRARSHVRSAITSLIWTEAERPDATGDFDTEDLEEELEAWLADPLWSEEAAAPGADIAALITALAGKLKLPVPPDFEPAWRSSG